MKEVLTFVCPFCGKEEASERGPWEIVYAQILMHFNRCSPPDRIRDTEAVMEAAVRITDSLLEDEDR